MMLIQIVVSITFFGGLLLLAYKAVKPVVISVKNRVHYLFGFRLVHISTLEMWGKAFDDLREENKRLRQAYAPLSIDKEEKGVTLVTVKNGKKHHKEERIIYQNRFEPAGNGHHEQYVPVTLRNGKRTWIPYQDIVAGYES